MGKLPTSGFVIDAIFASTSISDDYVGASSYCVNGQCVVGAFSSAGSVIVGLITVAVLILRPLAGHECSANHNAKS